MSTKVEDRPGVYSVTEESVIDYLAKHPEFFQDHPELLVNLKLPHESGSAVSLVERQVVLLREQADRYKRQLDQVIEVAKENEILNERLHGLTLMLIDTANFDEVLNVLQDELRDEFQADAVELRLFSSSDLPDLRDENAVNENSQLATFRDFFNSGSPLCGPLRDDQLDYLFGPQADEVGSAALIPLKGENVLGMLAIGSRSEQRFHRGMGIDFLVRLGQIVTRTLQVVSGPGA